MDASGLYQFRNKAIDYLEICGMIPSMANATQLKNLDRLARIHALLQEAEEIGLLLSSSAFRESGMETFRFTVGAARSIITQRHATAYLAVKGTLPEGYKSPHE